LLRLFVGMLAFAFRSFPHSLRRVASVQPYRFYSTPQEALATARKQTLKTLNSVPQGTSIASVWPPAIENIEVDSSIFNIPPSEFLNDGKEVDIDAISRKYDPEGEFSVLSQRLKDSIATFEAYDPLHEVLHGMGMTQIQYRRDETPSINWDFYKKNCPSKEFVVELEKNFSAAMKQADAFTSEGSPLISELNETSKRVEKVFLEQLTAWQAENRALDQEIQRVEAHQNEIISFGSQLEDLFVEDELAKDPELDRQLEADMMEGKWCVEDEDIPNPPTQTGDDTLAKALSKESLPADLDKKVSTAVWG